MGRLRDHMVDYMRARGYAASTIQLYTLCVAAYARHFGASPLDIDPERIPEFLLALRTAGRADATVRLTFEAIKFFLRMHGLEAPRLVLTRRPRRLPRVLSRPAVEDLLESCGSLRLKTLLTLIYSAGLRISEALNLAPEDVDFSRGSIFVRNGKGGKDRYTLLSSRAAALVRAYLAVYRPAAWLFYRSGDLGRPLSAGFVQRAFKTLAQARGHGRGIHVHTLRHCFATHLLEAGAGIFQVMRLLGHSSIVTTARYLHVQSADLRGLSSPFDIEPRPSADPGSASPRHPDSGELFARSA